MENRLVEVTNGRKLTESAIAHLFPKPNPEGFQDHPALVAAIGAWIGAKKGGEDSGIVVSLLNAASGASVAISVKRYARERARSRFHTQTLEGIKLDWDKDRIQFLKGQDEAVRAAQGGNGFSVPATLLPASVKNNRHHPAIFFIYSGYFTRGLPFRSDLKFVEAQQHWQAKRLVLGPGETREVRMAFPMHPAGTERDIEVRLLTVRQFADEMFLHDLIKASEPIEVANAWKDIKEALKKLD